jgi:prepilin-type N-terminal cleavage/methylation domain-containing protein
LKEIEMQVPRAKRGFTLAELLVVIGLIAILVSLILPAVTQSRGAARRAACTDKLRQLGLAMHNYESTYTFFPPGGVYTTTKKPGTIPTGNQDLDGRAPWTVLILPYLEENNRYQLFDFNPPLLS